MYSVHTCTCTRTLCIYRYFTKKIKMCVQCTCKYRLQKENKCMHSDYCIRTFLTPSLRKPFKHVIFFSTACRTACKHAFHFLRVLPEAVSTRHSWLWQTLDDVYTRRSFSESEETRIGAPGQKALPSVNEFTLVDFCLIPLSTTCSVEVPGTNL